MGGSGSSVSAEAGSDRKPNVFFILIDDMGYGDIGYQSTDLSLLTPNLDALMSGGRKVWYGMVYGIVWYMVWYGIWYGMVWYRMVCVIVLYFHGAV